MALTKEQLLGSWVVRDETPDVPVLEWWYHFLPDDFCAMEFFVVNCGWNVNWRRYSIIGEDEVSFQQVGEYQLKISPFPSTTKIRIADGLLYVDSRDAWPWRRSDRRGAPPPYDRICGIYNEVEVGPQRRWESTFRLLEMGEVAALQEAARAKMAGGGITG